MRRSTLPVLLFVLTVPACGSEVLVTEATSTEATGAGGAGGSTSTYDGAGGSITTYDGGGGWTSVGVGGAGGAPSCVETHDKLEITLGTWNGDTYACNAKAGDYEFSASVVDVPGPGLFVLDTCSPASDCAGLFAKLSVSAPGIYTVIPKGAYVRVHVSINPFMGGCSQRVQIKNLPSWDGDPNPVEKETTLWLFGTDGDPSTFPDTNIVATAVPQGCFPGEPPGCGEHEDYIWQFQSTKVTNDPGVLVPMGTSVPWNAPLDGQLQTLVAHNLRSYSTGICDGPVDLAYWIEHQYQLD